MIGFAFLAKMMQAFLVLPAFGLVYLVAAPTGLRRRLAQLVAGGLAIVVSAGWWVAIVALWPVGSRPFIDGSPDNNIFNLILGYNGLGRIFGASGGAGGGGGGGGGSMFSGATGLGRLFDDLMGGQASWLLPAALLALVVGLWTSRRAPRTDRTRAAMLLWGGWLIVSGLVFSLSTGIIHTYYTVALAPAIAALVAITATALWRDRQTAHARVGLALTVLTTAAWSWVLLDRTPDWESWLRPLILITGALAVVGLLGAPVLRRLGRRAWPAIAALAVVACLSGPLAYSAQTITTAHTGSIPSAGPSSSASSGVPGGAAGGGGGQSTTSSALVKALQSDAGRYRWVAAVSGSQTAASLELATDGAPVMAIGGFDGQGGNLSLAQFKSYVARDEIHYYIATGIGGGGGGGGRTLASPGVATGAPSSGGATHKVGSGAPGGLPFGSGAPGARSFGSGAPGGRGFSSGAPGGLGASSSSAITSWVKAHYKAVTIGGQTVYDLTQARA
jgi:4-amino-4-deoxy-L-arabinose transferase-like glycosyltransferase